VCVCVFECECVCVFVYVCVCVCMCAYGYELGSADSGALGGLAASASEHSQRKLYLFAEETYFSKKKYPEFLQKISIYPQKRALQKYPCVCVVYIEYVCD